MWWKELKAGASAGWQTILRNPPDKNQHYPVLDGIGHLGVGILTTIGSEGSGGFGTETVVIIGDKLNKYIDNVTGTDGSELGDGAGAGIGTGINNGIGICNQGKTAWQIFRGFAEWGE